MKTTPKINPTNFAKLGKNGELGMHAGRPKYWRECHMKNSYENFPKILKN